MSESTLRIGLLFPEVMGTYGDGGNALVLAQRARWRGINAEIITVHLDDPIPAELDIYHLGGGEDAAQAHSVSRILAHPEFLTAVRNGRPLLAICAGLQVLGRWYINAHNEQVPGVELLDCFTLPQGFRTIGELASEPLIPDLSQRLTGFENHGGATGLGADAQPFAKVLSGHGNGTISTEKDASIPALESGTLYDGVLQGSILATYMHGPALARNPELADWLLARALGTTLTNLAPLGEEPDIASLRAKRFAAAGLK